ncbi:TrgA family protein [Litoreibacter roseus]|uniref:Tellurium resistance protein n=1 Tax=Litoreibacter roseus TaxID=2601869 RepID=A0A6N6JMV8_9RHOB|nr:TrgA family protein [Litoreibacter roseus]GFE66658.1 tellurium resistance protein [Litoreibacter roseus]
MPTAAKIIAALIFGVTGYLTAQSVIPLLPEGMPVNWLFPVSVLIPVVCGWRVMGNLVGKNYAVAINSGIYTVVVCLFYVLLTFSISEMIKRSVGLRYDGPMEAIVGMFGIFVEYALLLAASGPLTYLIAGAVIGGIAAEWTNRRWS